jgi:arginyl-tRNA synthetase
LKEYLAELFDNAASELPYLKEIEISFSVPALDHHGDYSTNCAMLLAKILKKNPRQIATDIMESLRIDDPVISKVEIAGNGFINFFFNPSFVVKIIPEIIELGREYGKSRAGSGKRAIVEFVSANPTGPLTIGHGRNAVIGDTVANLLEWTGWQVDREYYFNNAGRQMRILGESVKLRYLELLGAEIDFPEDYYQGEYIKEIAGSMIKEEGDRLRNADIDLFKDRAEKEIFDDIRKTLKSIGIEMNSFYNEFSLYSGGNIDRILKEFEEKGLSYRKEGAVWLKLTQLGHEQDKVIVKNTGEPTYRLPDIAYHITKFKRDYEKIIDIFGSDHAATYPDVLAGVKSLGYDPDIIKVLIHQFVTIMREGQKVKMSTRKANYITLDELIDEVGRDVVRYFFIMRNMSSHLNFDLDLAKKQSDENPVFYLQYAHARISSILRMSKDEDLKYSINNLDLLNSSAEQSLIKKMYRFNDEIIYSAENFEPHRITVYLEELAAAFHKFYTECRIIGSEKKLAEARLALAVSAQIVVRNGLTILGLTAPDKM